MNLNESLKELRQNILRDVSDEVSADEADLLWDDATLTRYLNDGYFRFAQKTEYLQDATTPDVCQITLQDGVTEYQLNPAVLRVLTCKLGALWLPVESYAVASGDRAHIASFEAVRQNQPTGVRAIVADYEIGRIQLVGAPSAQEVGQTLNLRVTRYPLAKLDLSSPDTELEFPERFHLDILEWAAYRALRNHDADGENMAKASAHKTRFEDAVMEVKDEYRARKAMQLEYSPSWSWN